MKLDLNKSRILAKKSNLHNDALHIDAELWGWVGQMKPTEQPRLLNFWRKNENTFGVAPNEVNTSNLEIVPTEEFSKWIWQVQIVDDWDALDEERQNKVYAHIIQTGKSFFTIRFDK